MRRIEMAHHRITRKAQIWHRLKKHQRQSWHQHQNLPAAWRIIGASHGVNNSAAWRSMA